MDNSWNKKNNLTKLLLNQKVDDWIDINIDNTTLEIEVNLWLPNSFWRPSLKSDRIKFEHDKIVSDFLNHFSDLWYLTQKPVWINSWIDDTVYFIWAPISVLKPYITATNIPKEWVCMSQDCIRTRNTKELFNDENIAKWWSCFTWIAVLVPFLKWEELLYDSINFLLKTLNIPLNNIKIQINSEDLDLKELLESVSCPIEQIENEKEDKYYTHKYWMWKIVGRNFNFVLREKWTDNFNDIWNFIIIEDEEWKYWIELALWTSVIMKELYELDHIMDTSSITNHIPENDILYTKFKDSIVSSVLLFRLWIIPNASNTKGRIFRSYLRWILYFSNKFNISEELLFDIIQKYEVEEFNEDTWSWDFIVEYIKKIKNNLSVKKWKLSKEESFLID